MNHTGIKIGAALLVVITNIIIEGYPYAKRQSKVYVCTNDISTLIDEHVDNDVIKAFVNDSTKQAALKKFQESTCAQKE